jgi:hypothetical protein
LADLALAGDGRLADRDYERRPVKGLSLISKPADDQTSTSSPARDTAMLRASLVALGLDMLAGGISVGWNTAQRFQQHVATVCALPWPVPLDGMMDIVLPALTRVLDSPRRLQQGKDPAKSVLVGSLFVPVTINYGNELRKHDHTVQRHLLDILMITFFKVCSSFSDCCAPSQEQQDLRPVELASLGALQTIADFASSESATTLHRLLAIQIIQTAIGRLDSGMMLRAAP